MKTKNKILRLVEIPIPQLQPKLLFLNPQVLVGISRLSQSTRNIKKKVQGSYRLNYLEQRDPSVRLEGVLGYIALFLLRPGWLYFCYYPFGQSVFF